MNDQLMAFLMTVLDAYNDSDFRDLERGKNKT